MIGNCRASRFLLTVSCLYATIAIGSLCVAQPAPLPDDEFRKIISQADTLKWLRIEAISDSQAEELGAWKPLRLNPLPGTFENLDGLYLRNLSALSEKQAKSLAKSKALYIRLDGLSTVGAEQMRELAKFKGISILYTENFFLWYLSGNDLDVSLISFMALTKLSDGEALALSGAKAALVDLRNLKSLSAAQAAALSKYDGVLLLAQLQHVDSATVSALCAAKWRGAYFEELDVAALKRLEDAGVNFELGEIRRALYDTYKEKLKDTTSTKQ